MGRIGDGTERPGKNFGSAPKSERNSPDCLRFSAAASKRSGTLQSSLASASNFAVRPRGSQRCRGQPNPEVGTNPDANKLTVQRIDVKRQCGFLRIFLGFFAESAGGTSRLARSLTPLPAAGTAPWRRRSLVSLPDGTALRPAAGPPVRAAHPGAMRSGPHPGTGLLTWHVYRVQEVCPGSVPGEGPLQERCESRESGRSWKTEAPRAKAGNSRNLLGGNIRHRDPAEGKPALQGTTESRRQNRSRCE